MMTMVLVRFFFFPLYWNEISVASVASLDPTEKWINCDSLANEKIGAARKVMKEDSLASGN